MNLLDKTTMTDKNNLIKSKKIKLQEILNTVERGRGKMHENHEALERK